LISRSCFEKLVKDHKTEHGAKGLRRSVQFVTMLFGQISGQHSLRSIERGMNSWYHPGIQPGGKPVKRSTLSYANNNRSSHLFKCVFEWLLGEASPHGFRFKNPLYRIDATTIDLCIKLFPQRKGGNKADGKTGSSRENPVFCGSIERAVT
jgi:hypothetical protein